MKKPKKYWYITDIEECVLCGKEKKYRYRIYEPPEHPIRIKQFACHGHFI